MKHTLRDYQRNACMQVVKHRQLNPLLVAPTGSGKTTMGVHIANALSDNGVVWMAHRTELIDQAADRFRASGIDVGVIQADRPQTPDARIQVASVQTLARRKTTTAGVYIIDEAHRSAAATYRSVVPDGAIKIGLTATPFRTDGKSLGEVFGHIVQAATTRELVDAGVLMDPAVYVIRPPDMSGVKKRAGEYATGETDSVVNTAERRADIVDQWKQRCEGTRTLAFAVSVEHSRAIAAAFCGAGVPAEHVDADTPAEQRRDAIARLASGELHVLCNVRLFTEGFDLPELDTIIDAAPTASLGLHLQKIGRVMRVAEAKFLATVLDHAGNHLELGRVTQALSYSLDTDGPGVSRGISEPLGLRQCGVCYRLYAGDRCPECGATAPAADVPDITGDGDMVLLSENDEKERYFDRLCEEQSMNDRKDGWVLYRWKEKYDDWPTYCRPDGEDGPMVYVNPDNATNDIKRAYYTGLLEVALDKGFKPGWASVRYKDTFGVWPKGFVTEVKAELGVDELTEAWG